MLMKRIFASPLFASLLFATPLVASMPRTSLAHPGHGSIHPSRPEHYLFSFEHTAPLVAVFMIAAVIVGASVYRASAAKR
jgi:hypothetical protein